MPCPLHHFSPLNWPGRGLQHGTGGPQRACCDKTKSKHSPNQCQTLQLNQVQTNAKPIFIKTCKPMSNLVQTINKLGATARQALSQAECQSNRTLAKATERTQTGPFALLLLLEAALDDALGGQLRHRGPHPDHVDAGDGVPVQVVRQDQGAQDQQPGLVRRQPPPEQHGRWRRRSRWRGTWMSQVCTGFALGLHNRLQVS